MLHSLAYMLKIIFDSEIVLLTWIFLDFPDRITRKEIIHLLLALFF